MRDHLQLIALEHRDAPQRETLDLIETRFAADDEGTFSGHAALFEVVNGHREIIKRGAFAKTLLANRSVPMLWSHDPSQPVGVWTSIVEDARGLAVTGRLIRETSKGAEAHALMKAGAISGLSIGFRAVQAERSQGLRVLSEVALVEISLVTLPSASGARIHSVRNGQSPALASFVNSCRMTARALKGK
ncbi:HK97 family phage prohead protease [Antarcticirhabdus aurantiaca]|uniref:HK97 family phage prohead protease n=1 Tax=Antarcticirhabdus aurantiaca TaxID=2606717 RepID=A0ACD4NHL2_9HYPH|nr:HK97 family phage prohead protease [Jeongeuplla avenae]